MAIPDSGVGRELPRPVLQAMLVCDQAIREAETNKVSLVGIFDQIRGAEFPLVWARPTAVYARVTDAEGHYQIRLELVRLEDEQSVGRLDVEMTAGDRMGFSELIFNLDRLIFESLGRYEFRLFAGDRHVGGVVFTVIQIDER
jgi:hypothetical protein